MIVFFFSLKFSFRVDLNLSIKVGDFGLTRDMYQTNYYRKSNLQKCPIKWMPPEMLQYGISTEKSDIVSNSQLFEYDYYIVQLSVVVWSYLLGSVQPGFHSLSWSGKL